MFKQKKLRFLIPLICIFLIIVVVPPYKLVHLKSKLGGVFNYPLSFVYRTYISILNTKKIFKFYFESEKIQQENKRLKFELNQLLEQRLENERLHKILELKERRAYNFIAADVIGKEPTNWLNTLIIDKGENSGIAVNQPIMQLAGIVGKVIEVSAQTAKVILISDVNSRVIVLMQKTRQEGILEGIGRGLCRLKYLPANSELDLGDVVVSSGVGGVYPKGLVIGYVQSVRIERGGLYKSCVVKPAVKLSAVEEVLCLKSNLEKQDL